MPTTEADIKLADKKPRPVRSIITGKVIVGKVYPGPMTFQEYNEKTNPDG